MAWPGPDQTQETTTVMVCMADGTRQVSALPFFVPACGIQHCSTPPVLQAHLNCLSLCLHPSSTLSTAQILSFSSSAGRKYARAHRVT